MKLNGVQTMWKCAKAVLLSALACGVLSVSAAELPLAKLSNGETVSEKDFNDFLNRRADLKPLARNFSQVMSPLRGSSAMACAAICSSLSAKQGSV